MPGESLARAMILNLDRGGPPITCHFNPNEYSFSKQNAWTIVSTGGSNLPQLEFGGGQPAQLQMQLLFDTYPDGKDVRKEYTDKIWELMLVDENLKDPKNQRGRPPRVRFQWGASWSFDAVIMAIGQRFVLFLSDGTPVRAMLDVTFQQIKDDQLFPRQNPTSGGQGGERVVTVLAGDTLRLIAYREYGSVHEWRRIAEANQIDDLRSLQPGRQLRIPARTSAVQQRGSRHD
jgi:predicted Zn-dependent protease